MMKRITILLIAILLTACAAKGPAYQAAKAPENGNALVYIYRINTAAFGARDAYFYVDNKNIADLSVEGYTWFHVPAGEHKFEQKWPVDTLAGNPVRAKLQQIFTRKANEENANRMTLSEGYVNWEAGKTYYYRLATALPSVYPTLTMQWLLQEVTPEQALPELKKSKLQNSFIK
ncbi:DUF2846 domain-containing protein [Undibacterium umbellatum]|jgi:hypothetical protein|nr:DUF2846 domain-containing protein [Undibacterium umbellatum]